MDLLTHSSALFPLHHGYAMGDIVLMVYLQQLMFKLETRISIFYRRKCGVSTVGSYHAVGPFLSSVRELCVDLQYLGSVAVRLYSSPSPPQPRSRPHPAHRAAPPGASPPLPAHPAWVDNRDILLWERDPNAPAAQPAAARPNVPF